VPLDAPVALQDLTRRGLDVAGLRTAGSWAFAPEWLDALEARVRATLAARENEHDPGLPATALVGDAPWSADVVPLLGLERIGGRYYLPGRRPAAAPADEIRLGDGSVISRDAYDQARELLVAECERAGTITLARFRDLTGGSRRTAQLLLERFDSDRVTLRVGDARRLRRRG
jgi:hypothetical protein